MRLSSLLLVFCFLFPLFVWADLFERKPMIDVGIGVTHSTSMEALFKIDLSMSSETSPDKVFVLAKIQGQANLGTKGNSDIDMQFEFFGGQALSQSGLARLSAVALDIQRNVELHNDITARVQLMALRGLKTFDLTPEAKLILQGAADLIGFGLSRSNGQNKPIGEASGFSAKIGLDLVKKVHIELSQNLGLSLNQWIPDGYLSVCKPTTDPSGVFTYYQCNDRQVGHIKNDLWISNTQLQLIYDINQTFSLFGQARFQVIGYSSQYDVGSEQNPSSLNIGLGVLGHF